MNLRSTCVHSPIHGAWYILVSYRLLICFYVGSAIDNGANAIAEGFLFTVAAALIIGETWRSSRNQTKRREGVDDRLDELQSSIQQLSKRVDDLARDFDERFSDEKQTYAILSHVVSSYSPRFSGTTSYREYWSVSSK